MKWKRAPIWWLRRNQQTGAWKIVWNFEEKSLYSAPAKRALLRILPLNLWKGEFESLQTVGNSENIHWKNGEILEIQKATPLGTLSVSLKISRLVWLFGTPWGIRTPGLLVRRLSHAQIGVVSAPICAFCHRSFGGFSVVSVQPCPLFSDSGSKVGQRGFYNYEPQVVGYNILSTCLSLLIKQNAFDKQ